MARISSSVIAAVATVFAAQAFAQTASKITDFKPVTEAVLENPDPADWLMLSRTFDEQRFSPLKEINKSNIGQLRMAWTRGLPAGTQESTPIVYRGIMYINAPGATIQALDATNGDLIWEYAREYPAGVTPTLARSKSLGIYEDMIYFAAPDGFIVALDAVTGKLRWESKTGYSGQTAGGLLVADGKVLSNRTCEQGKRENCFIAAHDAKTGKELWKFYTTAAPGEPGGDTWGDVPVEQRAAGPWGLPGSYDPKRKVTYWGIANPNPYTRLTRHNGKADAVPLTAPVELYSDSTVAIDINTGKLVWYYQELPGDDWDADHNHERVLLRTKMNPDPKHAKWISPAIKPGEERDVIVTVAEGGGMFVVEQGTGKFLWARPFPYDVPDINMNNIDVNTGATSVNRDKVFWKDGDSITGCYHNTRGLWSIAYHPGKNSLYVPFQDQCLTMTANAKSKAGWGPRKGIIRPGSDPQKYMNIGKIDLSTGEMKVLYSQPQASSGSALVTAGDLMFWGDQNRRFRALDADDGKVLWESIVGGPVVTSTITYAAKGKQYVMIFTGEGQSVTAGPMQLTQNSMPKAVRGHNSVVVFALP
jgi:PQQ-dependent dehydrogenase (methanol/ethanol family)